MSMSQRDKVLMEEIIDKKIAEAIGGGNYAERLTRLETKVNNFMYRNKIRGSKAKKAPPAPGSLEIAGYVEESADGG